MSFGYFLFGAGAVTIASGLLFAKYMGFFKKVTVKDITISPSYLIYTRYQGNYKNLMPTIGSVKKDFSKFCTSDESALHLAPALDQLTTFGFYYDSPDLIVDQDQSRAIIGGMLPVSGPISEPTITKILGELNDLKSNNEYYFAKFTEPIKGYGVEFPLLNVLSIFYAIIRGYPVIKKYGVEMKLSSKVKFSAEIYDRNEKVITILFPYEGEIDQLLLSGAGQPAYCDNPTHID